MPNEAPDMYDLGLAADLEMLKRSPIDRRQLLRLGVTGLAAFLTGCATSGAQSNQPTTLPAASAAAMPTPAAATPSATAAAISAPLAPTEPAACVAAIPPETAGPFPADGSRASNQDLNVLTRSGIVRNDLRTSLGTGNVAPGIPLMLVLSLVDVNNNCAPLAGYAMYAWHCTADGNYSLYSNGVTDEDYLRGVQAADANGVVTFTTIVPGCYAGRWPHVHFEIYPALEQATGVAGVVLTSQLALPQDVSAVVYATDGYGNSARNLGQLSLETDGIFRDGYASQLATVTGDLSSGYTAQLTIGIAV